MGQRHQIFLIARVRPHGDVNTQPRYRCVAVLHQQWCYGRLPLKGARRFMTLVSQEDNAKIVSSELDAIQGKYGSCGEEEPKIPHTPCPYLSYLLATSWCVDLDTAIEAPYATGQIFQNDMLPACLAPGAVWNDDGITIIDVTDPSIPAYCFNMIQEAPISAKQYVRQYYRGPKPHKEIDPVQADILQSIAALEGEPMVMYEMLAEAWPGEYKTPKAKRTRRGTKGRKATRGGQAKGGEEGKAGGQAKKDTFPLIPSFADMALARAVPFALECGDTAAIEEMLWRSDKAFAVKSILRTSAMSDTALRLLISLVAAEQETGALDISGFSLSHEQFIQITPTLSPNLQSLDLSNNSSLTIDAVWRVLTAAPNLQKLSLLGCTAITNDDIYRLVDSCPTLLYHMEAFLHTAFLQPLMDSRDECPYIPRFTFIGMEDPDVSMRYPRAVALPYFTPARVVHALTVLLRSLLSDAMFSCPDRLMEHGLFPHTAFSAVPLREGQSWNQRTVANVPQYSTKRVGWMFCLKRGSRSYRKNGFAFVRWLDAPINADVPSSKDAEENAALSQDVESEVIGITQLPTSVPEIHDLKSFLGCMAAEGRPLPADEDVVVLEDLIQKLRKEDEERPWMNLSTTLFEKKDLIAWLNVVDEYETMMTRHYAD
ncbi:hypothetical protein OF83DRAFT_1168141 [Amylostereum chailletii]|nr:hypothetical protein OF83DRAFT_1168141 [Amylostereum chailletii]